jgi:hypothetical protein
MFMIRQASFTYGMHGISLWVLASDVARFRTLVSSTASLTCWPVPILLDRLLDWNALVVDGD